MRSEGRSIVAHCARGERLLDAVSVRLAKGKQL
jgi:hypothetical protein